MKEQIIHFPLGAFLRRIPLDEAAEFNESFRREAEEAGKRILGEGAFPPFLLPPGEPDPVKRAAILADVLNHMRGNPIPKGAPPMTRDEIHERP